MTATAPPDVAPLDKIDLRQLAEMEGPERAFLTLYVSSPEALGKLEDRVERARAFLQGEEAELEHFEESLKLLHAWLDEKAPEEFEGLAVFTSWALGLHHGLVLPATVPDLLRVGTSPYVRPLAELQDEYETFAVVAADNKASRIFVVTASTSEEEERVSGDVKNRVKKGGWSQKRYARRRENQLHHYAKDVAERLGELRKEHDFSSIVLLGSEETMHEIREALPTELADQVMGERAVDVKEGVEELVDDAYELYFEAIREVDEELWGRIREESLAGGLAVTGATRVLDALRQGRVEALLMAEETEIRGTRCHDCEHVVHGTPQTCQSCGSSDVFAIDLTEELVRLAETTSATTQFPDSIPALEEVGGVAALLRW